MFGFNFFDSAEDLSASPGPAQRPEGDGALINASKRSYHLDWFERTKSVERVVNPLGNNDNNRIDSSDSSAGDICDSGNCNKGHRAEDLDQIYPHYSLQLADGQDVRLVYNRAHMMQCKRNLNLDLQETSIVSGTYEGGGEVWECSLDLARYLLTVDLGGDGDVNSSNSNNNSNSSSGTKISANHVGSSRNFLEIGCGYSIPTLAVLKHRSHLFDKYFLSDFNSDVLSEVTWPNILINRCDESKVECLSGDWTCLRDVFEESSTRFALIVGAEVSYSVECCQRCIYLIDQCLEPDGIAVLATKRLYFGVDGGTLEIERICESRGLLCRVVTSFQDGNSNIRDIIEVKRRG